MYVTKHEQYVFAIVMYVQALHPCRELLGALLEMEKSYMLCHRLPDRRTTTAGWPAILTGPHVIHRL